MAVEQTNLKFLGDDGELCCWSLLPSSVSLLSGGTLELEKSVLRKATSQVWETQNKVSININHNYLKHLSLKLVLTDLEI